MDQLVPRGFNEVHKVTEVEAESGRREKALLLRLARVAENVGLINACWRLIISCKFRCSFICLPCSRHDLVLSTGNLFDLTIHRHRFMSRQLQMVVAQKSTSLTRTQ